MLKPKDKEINTSAMNETPVNNLTPTKKEENPYLMGMSGNTTQGATTSYSDQDMYDYLRSESAKELLDTSIALSVARQNASKSLATQMASQGLFGSGYAGTQATGINTAYLQGLQQAQAENASRIQDINLQEQQATQEANDNRALMVYSALESATGEQGIKDALALGGITYENGQFGGEGYDALTEDQKRQLQYYVGMAQQYNEEEYDIFNDETRDMASISDFKEYLNNAKVEEGTVAYIAGSTPLYVKYSHGRWVKVTKEEYDKANNTWPPKAN